MQGWQGAFEAEGVAQLGQGHVGLASQKLADGDAVLGDNGFFAACPVVEGLDVTKFAALLEELFDHAEGDVEAQGDGLAGAFTAEVGADNAVA